MRSAKAPTISAQVMAAKVAWKATKRQLGDHDALAEGRGRRESGRRCPSGTACRSRRRTALPSVNASAVAVDRPQHDDQREDRRTPASAPTACSWCAPGRRRTAPGRASSSGCTSTVATIIQAVSPLLARVPARRPRLRRRGCGGGRGGGGRGAAAGGAAARPPRRWRPARPAARRRRLRDGDRRCRSASRQAAGARETSEFLHVGLSVVTGAQSASAPVSPVRMRTTCSRSKTKILPSPILPVRAAFSIASITRSTQVVGDRRLDLDLGQEVDDVLGAAVQLGVALLAAEALDLGDGDALHADRRRAPRAPRRA